MRTSFKCNMQHGNASMSAPARHCMSCNTAMLLDLTPKQGHTYTQLGNARTHSTAQHSTQQDYSTLSTLMHHVGLGGVASVGPYGVLGCRRHSSCHIP